MKRILSKVYSLSIFGGLFVCLFFVCFGGGEGGPLWEGVGELSPLSKRDKRHRSFLSFCAVAKIRHRRNESTREKHVSLMQINSRSLSNLSLKTYVTIRPVDCGG